VKSPFSSAPELSQFRVFGLSVGGAALGVSAGPPGILGGLALVLAAVLPVPYAVGVGHVLLVALVPAGVGLLTVTVVEAGLVVALLTAGDARSRSLSDAVAMLSCIGVLVGVVLWALRGTDALVSVVAALVSVTGVASYGLHRYELVLFGLVEADR